MAPCVGAAAAGAGVVPARTTCAVSSAVARAASVWVEPGTAVGDAEGAAEGAAVATTACGGVACAGVAGVGAGAAGPSPGHSITRRDTPATCSMRGFSAATGDARSKTMRRVSASGCPVRTARTMPVGTGSRRPAFAFEAGRSTTSRSGPFRLSVLYCPAPASWISARVPVLPWFTEMPVTSPAHRAQGAEASRPARARRSMVVEVPGLMPRIQAPSPHKCKAFSLNNP